MDLSSSNSKRLSVDLRDFKVNISKTLNSHFLSQFNEKSLSNFPIKKQKNVVHLSSTPSIPVKVNTSINLSRKTTKSDKVNKETNTEHVFLSNSNGFQFKNETFDKSELIKSKYFSPFLLRKSSSQVTVSALDSNLKNNHSDSVNFAYANEKLLNQLQKRNSIMKNSSLSHFNSSSTSTSTLTIHSDSGMSSLNSTQLFLADLQEQIRQSEIINLKDLEKAKRENEQESNKNISKNRDSSSRTR